MALSLRAPRETASRGRYDLIVIGAGVHGICVALEAAWRGLRPLLLERDDFAGATSWASLRILHGGLRYLQSLDLIRHRESSRERDWFLRHFPDLTRPLPCLMPLYNRGLKRPDAMAAALFLNDALSRGRNAGPPPDRRIPDGKVLSPVETRDRFPAVRTDGLRGAAFWHDGLMTHCQRLNMELLRWAVSAGAVALNYLAADSLVRENGAVAGVRGRDRLSGQWREFRAPVVVNAAGPWCRPFAARHHRDAPALFRPQVAFNLLFDHSPPSEDAVAVWPRRPNARAYFLVPWRGRLFAGTLHAPWNGPIRSPAPPPALVREFIADVNDAVPGLALSEDRVVRAYAGLLPAKADDSSIMAPRPVWIDHGRNGGPPGFWTVSGNKYTTARLTAEKLVRRAFPGRSRRMTPRPAPMAGLDFHDWRPPAEDSRAREAVLALMDAEAVTCWEDLLLRRTDWGRNPKTLSEIRRRLRDLTGRADLPDGPPPADGAAGPERNHLP
jgi:glycerol-3-phosphate dehydrogenase